MRRLLGALLISLGTAVFSGAVAVLVDGLINGKPPRWWYLAEFTVAGLLLSGGGAWLLASLKTAVGVGVATTDEGGDPDRYQDEAAAFARFGESVFTAMSSLLIPVNEPGDLLLLLRSRLLAVLRTLTQVHRRTTAIGLLFQGRHQVGFHLGKWLNVAGRRIDLYADARDGTSSHFLAVRLTPAIRAEPRAVDIVLYTGADGAFAPGQRVTIPELREQLAAIAGQCMCLAVNLNGSVGEAGLVEPVQRSALDQGAAAVVVALPAPLGQPDAPRRELAPSRHEYESAVAAILAVADQMPASPGLLFFKTPAVISVALGHFLRAGQWIPMRYIRAASVGYERYTDPSRQ